MRSWRRVVCVRGREEWGGEQCGAGREREKMHVRNLKPSLLEMLGRSGSTRRGEKQRTFRVDLRRMFLVKVLFEMQNNLVIVQWKV